MPAPLFQKGNKAAVGKGRPKTLVKEWSLVQYCRQQAPKIMERMARLASGEEECTTADSVRAAALVTAYGYGQPKQTQSLEVKGLDQLTAAAMAKVARDAASLPTEKLPELPAPGNGEVIDLPPAQSA